MQSVSSRIWTRVAVSNSYDDNHYSTCTERWQIACVYEEEKEEEDSPTSRIVWMNWYNELEEFFKKS